MSTAQSQQMEQVYQQVQMLEEYISNMARREAGAHSLLKETSNAVTLVSALGKGQEPEALVPIGPGVYVTAKLFPDRKITLQVGESIMVEKEISSAVAYLEMKLKDIEIAIQDMAANRQNAAMRMEQAQQQLQQMLQASRQKSG